MTARVWVGLPFLSVFRRRADKVQVVGLERDLNGHAARGTLKLRNVVLRNFDHRDK